MGAPGQNPNPVQDVTLSVFGGRKTDIAPSDCPEGLTPDEQDNIFLPGNVQSRPGLSRLYVQETLTAGASVLYEKTYIQPNNEPLTLLLTSDGKLWVEDVDNDPLNPTSLLTVAPGLSAQSVTAFGREYIACSDLLHGQFAPLQFDGTNFDRVTQDGPGATPTVADYTETETVADAGLLGPEFTISGTAESGNTVTATTTAAHGFIPGQMVWVETTIAGLNGLQTIDTVPSTTTFSYAVTGTGLSSGSGSCYLPLGLIHLTGFADPNTSPNINSGDVIVLTGTGSRLDNGGTNPANWQVANVFYDSVAVLWAVSFSFATAPSTLAVSSTTGGSVFFGGQSSPGYHQVVCMFLTQQGGLMRPSRPLRFASIGGTQWQVTGLPIGPPNVVARVLAFTPAGGDNFFTIDADITLPNPVTDLLPESSGGPAPIVVKATIIEDNTSTTAVVDVPDNTLQDGIAIDQVGNDLFAQRVLGPVLGFFSYASRLACWGDFNGIENLEAMSFGGGTAFGGDVLHPLGWTVAEPGGQVVNLLYGGGTAWSVISSNPQSIAIISVTISGPVLHRLGVATLASVAGLVTGEVFTITGNVLADGDWIISSVDPVDGQVTFAAGAHAAGTTAGGTFTVGADGGMAGQITQPAFQDAFGEPILSPSTQYTFRVWLQSPFPPASGFVVADLFSPSLGTLAVAQIPANQITKAGGFLQADFDQALGATVAEDVLLRVYDADMPGLTTILHTDLKIVYTQNPYNNDLVHFSYALNPEGMATTTGDLGAADDDSAVQCLALLRTSTLLETLEGVHTFQDNDGEPSTWPVNQLTRAIGAVSVRAGDPGKFGTGDAAEDWALVAGKNGVYLFAGAEFWKVSQEISRGSLPFNQDPRPTWDDIEWADMQTIAAKNDPATRRAYFSVPIFGSATPNAVFALDYREMDTATQIASAAPVHITIQGKMKSSDLTRKWSLWNISANDIEILVRPGNQRQIYFAGGPRNAIAYGNIYSLDPAKLTDDDYGAFSPYYTTYAFTDHDQEQALGIGSDLHLYKHIHAFIAGVGYVTITPIVNSLWNFQPALSPRLLSADTSIGTFLKSDLEWTTSVRGQRVFFRIAVQPLFPGSTTDVQYRVQKFIAAIMKDPVAQFRQSGI